MDVTFINNDEMTLDYKWLHMPLKDFYQFRTSSIDFPEHYHINKQYYNIDYTWYTRNVEVVTFDDFKEIVHELKNSGVKSFSFALYDLNPQQEQEVVLFVYECDDSFEFDHQILSYQGQ